MSQQTMTQSSTIQLTKMDPKPHSQSPKQQKSESPSIKSAPILLLLLNLTLILSLYLSSLNATYYYTLRTAGEQTCLSDHFPSSFPPPSPSPLASSSAIPSNNYDFTIHYKNEVNVFEKAEMDKVLERARKMNCRYPCYSTFGKWIGNKGIGNQGWGSMGCEVVNSYCKAPLMKGRVGLDVVVWDWIQEML